MAEVNVRGLREFRRLLAATDKEAKRGLDRELRLIAEPIRADAERLAESSIPRIGPLWGKMRVGVTRKAVYVAPRQRGVNSRGASRFRRPRFADLMEQRAMGPALDRNKAAIGISVEALFERIADQWNRS